jgi:hypothetical protein
VNRGFNIRVFDEFKKAIEWLEQWNNTYSLTADNSHF